MPYVVLGGASELQIKVPTIGTTDWADTMRTDTFLKIAQHDHSGSGNGSQLGTGSLIADAVTGAKIRLDNDEYLRSRNAADTGNINMIKVDTNDDLYINPEISNLLMKNNTYILGRNQADSANINIVKVDGGDNLDFGAQVSVLNMKNNTNLTGRNNADSANINLIKVNTSDDIELGAEIAVAKMKNDTYITARNNADSGDINLAKVDTTDSLLLLNGREVLSKSVTLTDNTSVAATANVITLASNEAVVIDYKIIRGTDVVTGQLELEQSNALVQREEVGDDVGVTFSLSSDALFYTTTNTGNNATLSYNIRRR